MRLRSLTASVRREAGQRCAGSGRAGGGETWPFIRRVVKFELHHLLLRFWSPSTEARAPAAAPAAAAAESDSGGAFNGSRQRDRLGRQKILEINNQSRPHTGSCTYRHHIIIIYTYKKTPNIGRNK